MSNNIALDLAKSILQSKLEMLEENKTVGDSHGEEIEYIARIEDDTRGQYPIAQFKVVLWDELEGRTTHIVSWAKLVQLISSLCLVDWEKCSPRMWPITSQKDVDKDIHQIENPPVKSVKRIWQS